jgi:1-phosphofructokinase
MKKIITVTLNPAFDLHYAMESFEAGKENYVTRATCDAGGKGINISRALTVNGVENTAYVILGRENAPQFEQELRRDGLAFIPLYTDGRIRENITVHPAKGKETRISLDSFSVGSETLSRLCHDLCGAVDADTLIAFSGRIPKGLTKEEIKDFLAALLGKGACIAVDSNSLTPEDLAEIRPWFIKPNEQEIAAFVGREITTPEEAAAVAAELASRGLAREVMISLGAMGSVWSDGNRRAIINAPDKGKPLSTIGAGDSTVAGYLAAVARGEDTETALRVAASFGSAACYTEGTRPPMPDLVRELFAMARVQFL